jgi:hypothetical protein
MEASGGWRVKALKDYPRDTTMLNETRALPFLRDVLRHGLGACGTDDYLVFTNDDNILIPGLKDEIKRVLSRGVALTANRIDIDKWNGTPPASVATNHQGRDLLAFKASWLRLHLEDLYDYALGLCDWDIGIAAHIRHLHGKRWHHDTSWQIESDCELTPGWVLHEKHQPTYPDAKKFQTPGLIYNRKLLKKWINKFDPEMSKGFFWFKSLSV